MSIWRRLFEYTMGMPDERGLDDPDRTDVRGDEFPYDKDSGDVQSPTEIHGAYVGGPPVPKDTAHTAWDKADESMGAPMSTAKASPGQMANVTPGGKPFAGDPFVHHVSDDELEKAGDVKESRDDMGAPDGMSDDELEDMMGDMEDEQDPKKFPGSEPPSDIMVFSQSGFVQGLGHSQVNGRDLFGIRDSAEAELPKKTTWSYLEALLPEENPEKE